MKIYTVVYREESESDFNPMLGDPVPIKSFMKKEAAEKFCAEKNKSYPYWRVASVSEQDVEE